MCGFCRHAYARDSRRLACVLRLKNMICVRSTVLTKSPKSCAWKSCSWRLTAADQSDIFHSVDNLFLHFRLNREQQNRPESKMNRRVYVHRVWNNGKPVKLSSRVVLLMLLLPPPSSPHYYAYIIYDCFVAIFTWSTIDPTEEIVLNKNRRWSWVASLCEGARSFEVSLPCQRRRYFSVGNVIRRSGT